MQLPVSILRTGLLALVGSGPWAALGPTAASAREAFPVGLDAGGVPSEVSGAGAVLAWLTTADGEEASAVTLHVRSRGAAPVAVPLRDVVDRLSVGTDERGEPVVLAVRRRDADGERDVVRLDPATGEARPVPAAARTGVDELSAAVDRGRLVVARRDDRGRGPVAVYATTLAGGRLRRLQGSPALQPSGTVLGTDAETVDVPALSVAPGRSRRTVPRVAALLETDYEWESQRVLVFRGSERPRCLDSLTGSGAGGSVGFAGVSWESATRLWYGSSSEDDRVSRLVRWSTLTGRRAQVRGTVGLRDLTWAGGDESLVGVSPAADRERDLRATGAVRTARYRPRC